MAARKAKAKFNGWTIEADEPTTIPSLRNPDVTYISEDVRTLLLEDGRLVLKCRECDYWAGVESPQSVLSHRRIHNPKHIAKMTENAAAKKNVAQKSSTAEIAVSFAAYSLNELFDAITDSFKSLGDEPIGIVAEMADATEWKRRALAAEEKLAQFRKMMEE